MKKLLVCKRKQLIDELVQRKHDRHLYVEIARLEKEKKEIAARITGLRQDSHSVPFFFKPNVELEMYLLNEIREMGKIQEKVDGSDEILEDTIKICTGYEEENLKFYRNEITSKPLPGNYIEDILQWKGDYKKLESGRSYFQWLFPVIEPPVYLEATQQLFVHEAQAISTDAVLRARVLRAYTMMLDFFGMELVDETSGEIRRRNYNWKERYQHLNGSRHNHDRITRMLKSLGELGYEKLQWPLVKFIMAEAVVNKALPYLNSDVMNRWIAATKNEQEGLWMYKLWQNMRENPERFDQLGNSRASTL